MNIIDLNPISGRVTFNKLPTRRTLSPIFNQLFNTPGWPGPYPPWHAFNFFVNIDTLVDAAGGRVFPKAHLFANPGSIECRYVGSLAGLNFANDYSIEINVQWLAIPHETPPATPANPERVFIRSENPTGGPAGVGLQVGFGPDRFNNWEFRSGGIAPFNIIPITPFAYGVPHTFKVEVRSRVYTASVNNVVLFSDNLPPFVPGHNFFSWLWATQGTNQPVNQSLGRYTISQ